MAIAEKILIAVAMFIKEGSSEFSRNDIRKLMGVDRDIWGNSYSPIFQGMRIDQPGGAPVVKKEFKGVFRRVKHGKYKLTEHGQRIIEKMMPKRTWRDAVLQALHRYSNRYNTKIVTRQGLISEELNTIINDVNSRGKTPEQTLSKILQQLRDEEVIFFLGNGNYLLVDYPIYIETENLPNEVIDLLIDKGKLKFDSIPTKNTLAVVRQRKGQDRIRSLTLENYGNQCAFCDVADTSFLVASHIARWADEPDARGDLSNVICMCKLHDALFEQGYFSMADDYSIIKKEKIKSQFIEYILNITTKFKIPIKHSPSKKYLEKHRRRTGFE